MRTKTCVLITLICLTLQTLWAQEQPGSLSDLGTPEERASLQAEDLALELGLNDRAKDEVREIYTRYHRAMDGDLEEGMSRFQKLRVLKKHTKQRDKEMKDVLSEGQYDAYRRLQNERKETLKEQRAS